MGGFNSVFGLTGGLDVQSLVAQLMFVERAPIRRLDTRISQFQARIDAYNQLNTRLSELLSSLDKLNDEEAFAAKSTTSSHETLLKATASGAASEGTYLIRVDRLALFDNLASDAGFSTGGEAIGTGSFDLVVGSTSTTIEIDAANNTLEGLRRSINDSGAEVNASIIHDGAGYRLTITSRNSGSASAISIENNTLTLSDGATPFQFSRTHDIGGAGELDAALTVNGLAVTSSSNAVENVIEGVTLSLRDASTSTVTLTVANDTDQVKANIQAFVDSYNKAYGFINSQFQFVEAAGRSGVLASEFTVREIQFQLAQVVTGRVTGLPGELTTLGSAGIEMTNDGTLQINSAVLDEKLSANFEELKGLFVALAETSHTQVGYLSSAKATQPGTYRIDITAVPAPAALTSPDAIGATLGVDEVLTFTMGAKVSTVNLTAAMDLDTIVEAVNSQFQTDGVSLTASKSGSSLVVTSNSVGHQASFSVVSDVDGAGTGIGTGGLSESGVSVAGTFTNPSTLEVYEATGNGATLEGSAGATQGLKVRFTGDATGNFGTVTFTLGYAAQLHSLVSSITDSLEGSIHNAVEGYRSDIKTIQERIRDTEDRLATRERYLTAQFSRANQALQQLQFLQATLGVQLNQLSLLR